MLARNHLLPPQPEGAKPAGALNFFNMNLQDLCDFFEEFDVAPKKENQRSFIFDCPVCGGKEKLYIEKNKLIGICFRKKDVECPTPKTSLLKTLSLLSGLPLNRIKEWLNAKRGTIMTDPEVILEPVGELLDLEPLIREPAVRAAAVAWAPPPPISIPADFLPISALTSRPGLTYLLKRGLDITQLEQYDIRYSASRSRVIFPVKYEGQWVGYQGRTIYSNVEPRMYNLPGAWKTNALMFWDENVRSKRLNYVVIAEGAVSALKLRDIGGFVALMGKTMSMGQWHLLNQPHITEFYLALDPDAYEQIDAIASFIRLNRPNSKIYFLPTPKGYEDFGDCTYEVAARTVETKIDITQDSLGLYEWILHFDF